MPRRYRPENILRAVSNPRLLLGELHYIGQKWNVKWHRWRGHNGTDILSEDWDNLLILDGCRYDLFNKVVDMNGKLEKRISHGSDSKRFIEGNFIGKEALDTVYVTANPFAQDIPDGAFHSIINLLDTNWDPNLETVPPETVVNKVREAKSKYKNKRLIVHFMQPHYPFIGDFGRRIDESGISKLGGESNGKRPIWKKLRYGFDGLTTDDVWRAYEENLELVLAEVESLLPDLSGRTVITSDHGNLVGDRLYPLPAKGYGHPRDLFVKDLVEVPWFVIEKSPRPEIIPEAPNQSNRASDEHIEDRLASLGYR